MPEPQADGGELSLEELMSAYQQADPMAAAELVRRLSSPLYRFFAAPMGNQMEADDMLQDMWLRIHRLRHTHRPGEPVLPWVYAIARRVRVDNYRKRRRSSLEVAVDQLPELAAQSRAPGGEATFQELLASLPESQREVLVLLKQQGLSLEDVARATSCSVGSVKQKVHRAYQSLRALLRPALPAGRKGATP
ncbi:MAG: RNA polymerase sigma factor [Acidobacteria bacterium]|nr:RNA polymerase sigma factor [Acidobacteriota bacterium]